MVILPRSVPTEIVLGYDFGRSPGSRVLSCPLVIALLANPTVRQLPVISGSTYETFTPSRYTLKHANFPNIGVRLLVVFAPADPRTAPVPAPWSWACLITG